MTRPAIGAYLRNYGIVWVTLALIVLLSLTTPSFLSTDNVRNILDQQAITLIVAVFATIVLIAGGFDVSLSAIFILAPLVALRLQSHLGSGIGLL